MKTNIALFPMHTCKSIQLLERAHFSLTLIYLIHNEKQSFVFDIKEYHTKDCSFHQLLSMMPEIYSANHANVQSILILS